jgi:hypothetical protein
MLPCVHIEVNQRIRIVKNVTTYRPIGGREWAAEIALDWRYAGVSPTGGWIP